MFDYIRQFEAMKQQKYRILKLSMWHVGDTLSFREANKLQLRQARYHLSIRKGGELREAFSFFMPSLFVFLESSQFDLVNNTNE